MAKRGCPISRWGHLIADSRFVSANGRIGGVRSETAATGKGLKKPRNLNSKQAALSYKSKSYQRIWKAVYRPF